MRLQSHDEFAHVARFHPVDGDFVVMRRESAPRLLDEPLGGVFSQCLDRLVVLYRGDDGLHLRIGEVDHRLDEVSLTWFRSESIARLVIETISGVEVFEYPAATVPGFDFSAGAEEEHFDFGLFLANVAADQDRAARLYLGVTSS